MSEIYTGAGLAKGIGATYRQIDHWMSKGYIKSTPINDGERRVNPGSGHARIFTGRELETARYFARLVRGGMNPAEAAPIAEKLAADKSFYMPGGIEIRRVPIVGDPS